MSNNINTSVLITGHQFSENHHGEPKRGVRLLFFTSLVLTFGVRHQYLVVGENVAARGYIILVINNQSNLQ